MTIPPGGWLRSDKILVTAVFGLLFFVALRFMALQAGLAATAVLPAALAALLLLAWWHAAPPATGVAQAAGIPARPRSGWSRLSWLPAPLFAAAAMVWIYRHGAVLPAHDPLAIPSLAQVLRGGQLPSALFPQGSFAHAYPPGGPILYALLPSALEAARALTLMKMANLLVIALIPATWGWLYHRLHGPRGVSIALWLPLCYFAFWGLERTIGFALPFAGKNALTLGIFLVPMVALGIVQGLRTRWTWPLAGLGLFGLMLINYSLLHLVCAVLGGYLLVQLWRRRLHLPELLALAGVMAVAGVLVLVCLHEAISDPRAGSFHFAPWAGLWAALGVWLQELSPVVLFNGNGFGLHHAPYRGAIFLLAWAVAMGLARRFRLDDVQDGLLASLVATLLPMAFAMGIVPAGISLDYARWILWPPQAIGYAWVLAAFAQCALRLPVPGRLLAAACAVAIVGGGTWLAWHDNRTYARVLHQQAVTRGQLREQARLLETLAGPRACVLVGDSVITADNLSAIQFERVLDHMEIVSRCRWANGSWIYKGPDAARAWDGLPSPEHLRQLQEQGEVLLIGRPQKIETYLGQLRQSGEDAAWAPVHALGAVSVWKHRPPSP